MEKIFRKYSCFKRAVCLSVILAVCIVGFGACDKEDLDIRQNFPFEVSVMPVPKDIAVGQTVEIRITIEPAGSFVETEYFIRYFQFEGEGTLQYDDEPPYLPNDLYLLPDTNFRLYYTSQSTAPQEFDVWISDSFGNERQISFQFANSD